MTNLKKILLLVSLSFIVYFSSKAQPVVRVSGTNCVGSTQVFIFEGSCTSIQWSVVGDYTIESPTTTGYMLSVHWNSPQYGRYVTATTSGCSGPLAGTFSSSSFDIADTVTPSVSISPISPSICVGDNLIFSATAKTLGTPSFQWKIDNVDQSGQTETSFSSAGFTNGQLVSVTMNSSSTCQKGTVANSNVVQVVVNAPQQASVVINGNPSLCVGNVVSFTATPTNGGNSPQYQWQVNGSNVTNQTVGTPINKYVPNTALNNGDVVKCVLTSSAICIAPQTVTSNIKTMVNVTIPDLPVLVTYNSVMCKGSSQVLKLVNQGTNTVKWFDGNDFLLGVGAIDSVNNIAQDKTIKVQYTDPNNCISDKKNISVLTDKIKADFSVPSATVKLGGTATVTNLSADAFTYKWTMSGDEGVEETLFSQTPVLNFNIPGSKNIKLVATSLNNCKDSLTKAGVVTVAKASGTEHLKALNIKVYPNPVRNFINIDFTGQRKDAAITIFTVAGVKLMEKHIKAANGIEIIDISLQPAGNYLMVVTVEDASATFKLEKN